MVHPFDLPNLDNPAASSPRILIAGAGSNEGSRGADCWFVASPGSEPIPVGSVRPAAALGLPAEPPAAGGDFLFELSHTGVLERRTDERRVGQVGGRKGKCRGGT